MDKKLVSMAPSETIILDTDKKSEIRIYNGDNDPDNLNRKRIGVYLFVSNKFICSEWVECGKIVRNILVNDPTMTIERKQKLTNNIIESMKNKWEESNK